MSARSSLAGLALASLAAFAWLAGAAHAGEAPPPARAAGAAPGAASPDAGDAQLEAPSVRDDREILDASERWLGLVDAGKLGAAWDGAAKVLQNSVTRKEWISGIGEARKPFGKVATRTRDRFARTHTIPGAPDGDYAIIHFVTNFTNGRRALEQVVWLLDTDVGIWRVSGYFIR